MRKIQFDDKTISAMREYASTHTVMECCNRFTLKPDTFKRVAKEHGIICISKKNTEVKSIPDETVQLVCRLYENTKMRIQDIRNEAGIRYSTVLEIINSKYSKEYQDARKAHMYRQSKLAENNPMFGKTGENHPGYIGTVSDGNGYLMCLKPDWYTGRPGSKHVFLHSVVMCEALGITEIPKGFVVHHVDGNKLNNDISNLALLTTSAHGKLHSIERNLCYVQRSEKIRKEDNSPNAEQ